MAFWPGSMRLCPWSVLWSGGLTMRSDRHHPPAPGGIRRGRSSRALCGMAAWRGRPGREKAMPVQAAAAKGTS